MIGRLRGTLLEKQAPQLLLDVNGVAYEIESPMSTFYPLPDIGQEITLYTHLVVRDDAHLLYGFHTARERTLFRALIKVNGVGPKLALTILSGLSPDDFVACVAQQNSLALTRVPGVGKKTAERLIIEMRDRLQTWEDATVVHAESGSSNSITQDAISALIALGYKPVDASRAVKKVANADMNSEDIIRLALQGMMA